MKGCDTLLMILDCRTDPNVPPLPPHIGFKEAKNFLAMTTTEPERSSVLRDTVRQLLASVLPGRRG